MLGSFFFLRKLFPCKKSTDIKMPISIRNIKPLSHRRKRKKNVHNRKCLIEKSTLNKQHFHMTFIYIHKQPILSCIEFLLLLFIVHAYTPSSYIKHSLFDCENMYVHDLQFDLSSLVMRMWNYFFPHSISCCGVPVQRRRKKKHFFLTL